MAKMVIARAARTELEWFIRTHSLPADTKERFGRAIDHLREFPGLGPSLVGRWSGYRSLLGPWRWMLVVYHYDTDADVVVIVTVQDARSRRSPTSDT